MGADPRIGINLCWLVPGTVGGSEEAITRVLRELATRHGRRRNSAASPVDLDIVLFVLDAFVVAHPDLAAAFETHVLRLPGRLKPLRVLAEYTWLPWQVARRRVDVLHDAGGTSPGRVRVPRVLTIHDIQPLDLPSNFGVVRARYVGWALPAAAATAAQIMVPSTFVRDRVVDRLGVDADDVAVVPWSTPTPGPAEDAAVMRAALGIEGRFVLLASITYPHKDHATAVRAMHRLAARHPDVQLVLAGGPGPAEDAVTAVIAEVGMASRVVRPGRVAAERMATLLTEAAVVVVPSRYEGFGIPALEAMAAGVPVIVADAGSLPEVVGDAGIVFPVGDDAQLAIALHGMLTDEDARAARIAAGRRRAELFTPARAADGFEASYQSVVLGR